jgi:hypothetical protein
MKRKITFHLNTLAVADVRLKEPFLYRRNGFFGVDPANEFFNSNGEYH